MSLTNRTEARLSLLGEPALARGEHTYALRLPARAVVVLAHLAVRPQRPIARTTLAAQLWPDIGESDARANLRRCLHLIARAFPELAFAISHTKTHVSWDMERAVSCDVIEFSQAANDPARYERAIELYRADLCAGVDDSALDPLRAELATLFARTLHAYVQNARMRGDSAAATLGLKRLIATEPYDEEIARTLIRVLLDGGDRGGALREYHALVKRLREDLDVEPQDATRAMLPFVLGANAYSSTPTNINRPGDLFLAREIEMHAVAEAVSAHRVVRIAGGAGIGKTRLATEVAHVLLERYPGGAWFVDLARSTTLESALERIVETVGAAAGMPPLDALAIALDRTDILLVLDNLEQLGELEDDVVAGLVARTNARYITTTRRVRAGPSPRTFHLEPLAVPPDAPSPPELLARYPAVTLFLERATKVAPAMRVDFANARSLGRIARKLDGVPLAIELVASRANLLTLDGIAKRLDDHASFSDRNRVGRHVNIDAAIAWSYELLTEAEQCVFRSIAVFASGYSFDALESVCADTCAGDIIAIASELIESSLLTTEHRSSDVRVRAYDATRRFAAARLDASGERLARSLRHLRYYAELAEDVARDFGTAKEREAFARCDLERDNFEVALDFGTHHDVEGAVRLFCALAKYWIARGLANVGRRATLQFEARPDFEKLDVASAARFALSAAAIAREVAFSSAETYLDRASAGFRASGDARGENDARFSRAAYTLTRGAFTEATELYEECLDAFEAFGDTNGIASSVVNLAQIAWTRSDYGTALDYLERARTGFEQVGNARGIAHVFRSRGLIYGALGRHDEAIAQAREAVLLYQRLEEPSRVAEALSALCDACTGGARYAEAFAAALRSFEILQNVAHDVYLMHSMNALMLACAAIDGHEDVLRIYAIAAERARRIGRTEAGLDDYHEAVARARAALPAPLADAAYASGRSLGITYCMRVARERFAEQTARDAEVSDVARTVAVLL